MENFLIDFFLLQITYNCLNTKTKLNRIILAATVGGFYTFAMLFSQLHFLTCIPWKLSIGFLMVYICGRDEYWKLIIKAYLLFIMFGMLLAGVFTFLQLNSRSTLFSYKYLIFSLMLIYVFAYRIIFAIRSRINLSELIYDVDIVTKENNFKVKGFWDTGNELCEPATMLPVIIIEKSIFKNIYNYEFCQYKIPYKAFNAEKNFLIGFKPEYVILHIGNKSLKKQVIVALCDMKLNSSNDYNALLSREVI